jgi:molecular chaperone DnaJ
MSKNYYDILGVDKKASKDEVKKAFRKLAHQYHPDKKGGDESKFKELNEAYSILSDDEKRGQYDMYGQTFAGGQQGGGQGGYGGGSPFEGFDFSQFTQGGNGFQGGMEFDLGDIFGEFFGGGSRSRTQRGRDISIDIELNFEEAIFGVERNILLNKVSICNTCNGNGAKIGTEKIECKTCNGKGKIREMKRTILGSIEVNKVCESCFGEGKVPKERCNMCNGLGVFKKQEEIRIKIPAGIENGEMIRMTGGGEAVRGGQAGDLYIKTHVKAHKIFHKEGANLVMNLDIKLSDAILGATQLVQALDGSIDLRVPEGSNTGDILRIKGRGVPVQGRRGDILVNLRVAIPKKLSKSAKDAIQKLREEGM